MPSNGARPSSRSSSCRHAQGVHDERQRQLSGRDVCRPRWATRSASCDSGFRSSRRSSVRTVWLNADCETPICTAARVNMNRTMTQDPDPGRRRPLGAQHDGVPAATRRCPAPVVPATCQAHAQSRSRTRAPRGKRGGVAGAPPAQTQAREVQQFRPMTCALRSLSR